MKAKAGFQVMGRPIIKVYEGEVKPENLVKEIKGKNALVNNGLKAILDKLGEDAAATTLTGPTDVWVGSGSTAVTFTDTDLDTFESEKSFTSYLRAGGLYTGTWSVLYGTGDGNHEWEEIALADGVHASGTMWTRFVFTAQKFTKTSSQQVVVEYELIISRA
jgi:hypothetical protein